MQNTAENLFDDPVTGLVLIAGMQAIGQAPDNDIILSGADVSQYHARVVTYFHQSFVIDLNSETGTFLNGKRIVKHSLKNGDILQFGQQKLAVKLPQFD